MDKPFDLICIGSALVDSIIKDMRENRLSGYGYIADSGSLNPGGEAFNVSVTASKLGLRTGILCHLGRDHAGKLIYGELSANGVDTGNIIWDDSSPTPVSTLIVDGEGRRKSVTNKAHRYNFHPERFRDAVSSAVSVAIGSLFRAPFDELPVIEGVVMEAKRNGALVFADTKLPNFRKIGLEDIKTILPFVDYIFPNRSEAEFYTGKNDPGEMADVFLSYGVKGVIVKLGREGCLYRDSRTTVELGAYEVDALDETGAGDNFLAGFIAALRNGADTEDALRFASACGAVCASAVGAVEGLRNREQVERFMEKAGVPQRRNRAAACET